MIFLVVSGRDAIRSVDEGLVLQFGNGNLLFRCQRVVQTGSATRLGTVASFVGVKIPRKQVRAVSG